MNEMERLRELEEQVSRKRWLENRLRTLQQEERELQEALVLYAGQAAEEQGDVDALTARTFRGFLARLQKNTYRDRLTREEKEAAAALAKYETAKKRLEELTGQIRTFRMDLREVRKAEQEYRICMEERRTRLMSEKGAAAEAIAALEKEMEEVRADRIELSEALTAGKRVNALADEILAELKKAEGWGLWDTFGGGGWIADAAKYDHLEKASRMTESLSSLMGSFREELADVALCTDLQVELGDFLRFADLFWDGIFVDYTVLNRIRENVWKIRELQKELEPVMEKLRDVEKESDRKLAILQNQMEKAVFAE